MGAGQRRQPGRESLGEGLGLGRRAQRLQRHGLDDGQRVLHAVRELVHQQRVAPRRLGALGDILDDQAGADDLACGVAHRIPFLDPVAQHARVARALAAPLADHDFATLDHLPQNGLAPGAQVRRDLPRDLTQLGLDRPAVDVGQRLVETQIAAVAVEQRQPDRRGAVEAVDLAELAGTQILGAPPLRHGGPQDAPDAGDLGHLRGQCRAAAAGNEGLGLVLEFVNRAGDLAADAEGQQQAEQRHRGTQRPCRQDGVAHGFFELALGHADTDRPAAQRRRFGGQDDRVALERRHRKDPGAVHDFPPAGRGRLADVLAVVGRAREDNALGVHDRDAPIGRRLLPRDQVEKDPGVDDDRQRPKGFALAKDRHIDGGRPVSPHRPQGGAGNLRRAPLESPLLRRQAGDRAARQRRARRAQQIEDLLTLEIGDDEPAARQIGKGPLGVAAKGCEVVVEQRRRLRQGLGQGDAARQLAFDRTDDGARGELQVGVLRRSAGPAQFDDDADDQHQQGQGDGQHQEDEPLADGPGRAQSLAQAGQSHVVAINWESASKICCLR